MFDILSDILARARAQDRFGSDRPATAQPAHAPTAAPSWPGASGAAAPGVVSPAAETVLDERELYLANSASFDARWANDSLLARALARFRGEDVADPAIAPELGAPTSSRPLADPETVIAGVMAEEAPAAPASSPAAPAPHSGPTERELYLANSASFDARWENDPLLARAMARHRGEAVADPAIRPELGAPARQRPLADPASVIADVVAQSAPQPAAAPAAPPAPYSGLSPEEEYRSRRAAMDARAGGDDFLARALARHAARKAGGGG